jgi:hypothetical protein
MKFAKIVSGGQTGVDRAALELGLPCGGWCPRGRRAEDGPIDPRYPLQETPLQGYPQRTEWNVRDSDGTLLILMGCVADRGTALTGELAERYRRPCFGANLWSLFPPADLADLASRVYGWARDHGIRVLNVAGPRESSCTGAHERAREFLRLVLG